MVCKYLAQISKKILIKLFKDLTAKNEEWKNLLRILDIKRLSDTIYFQYYTPRKRNTLLWYFLLLNGSHLSPEEYVVFCIYAFIVELNNIQQGSICQTNSGECLNSLQFCNPQEDLVWQNCGRKGYHISFIVMKDIVTQPQQPERKFEKYTVICCQRSALTQFILLLLQMVAKWKFLDKFLFFIFVWLVM